MSQNLSPYSSSIKHQGSSIMDVHKDGEMVGSNADNYGQRGLGVKNLAWGD